MILGSSSTRPFNGASLLLSLSRQLVPHRTVFVGNDTERWRLEVVVLVAASQLGTLLRRNGRVSVASPSRIINSSSHQTHQMAVTARHHCMLFSTKLERVSLRVISRRLRYKLYASLLPSWNFLSSKTGETAHSFVFHSFFFHANQSW